MQRLAEFLNLKHKNTKMNREILIVIKSKKSKLCERTDALFRIRIQYSGACNHLNPLEKTKNGIKIKSLHQLYTASKNIVILSVHVIKNYGN